jgi:DnaJ-class molecular chaperone
MDGDIQRINKDFEEFCEAYRQGMQAAGRVECRACDGTGIPDDDDKDCCPKCQGDGWIFPEQLN